jgi:hypothetical protein
MGAVIFFRMIPLTRPASEFQLTWSPILNLVDPVAMLLLASAFSP